jgi:multiple sugar transport system substrate-binding protein
VISRIHVLIIFLLLSLSPFSCENRGNFKNQKILYWSANNPDEIIFAKQVVNEWNELRPAASISFQPVPEGRSSEEIILAAVVGKTTPDIYSNMWQGDVEAYAQGKVLIALDTISDFLEFMQTRCDSATLAEVTSLDGHIYQIPWKINPIMTLYNVNIFNELDFRIPPANYSEFIEAASRFQRDLDGDGYVDHWIGYSEVLVVWYQRFFDFYPLYLAASHGAPLVSNDKVVFNNSYAVEVFRFLQTLYLRNYFPRERLSARSDPFLSSTIATRFAGPWEIAHAEKFKPEGFAYNFSSLPVPDDHQGEIYTYGDPKNIVLFNTCRRPEQAWEFLKFMISKKNDLQFMEITHQIPRRKNLFNDVYFKDYFDRNPKMIPFAKQAEYVRGTDVCSVLKEIFDIISREYEACVIYGIKTPEQAIADAASAAQLLLD